MEVSLPDDLAHLVEAWVRDGAYESPTAVVTEALNLLVERDGDRARAPGTVRAKVAEGLEAIGAGDVHPGDQVFDELSSCRSGASAETAVERVADELGRLVVVGE